MAVSSREVVSAFWAAMQANDWEKAAGYWRQSASSIGHAQGNASSGHVVHQVEYWPTAYGPLPGRDDLTHPTERIP